MLNSNSRLWKQDFTVDFLLRYGIRLIANPEQISSVCLQNIVNLVVPSKLRYNFQRFHRKFQAWNGRKLRSVMDLFPLMDTALNIAKGKRPLASSIWHFTGLQWQRGMGGYLRDKNNVNHWAQKPMFFHNWCLPLTFVVTSWKILDSSGITGDFIIQTGGDSVVCYV